MHPGTFNNVEKKGGDVCWTTLKNYSDCAIFILTLKVDETCSGYLVRLSVFFF